MLSHPGSSRTQPMRIAGWVIPLLLSVVGRAAAQEPAPPAALTLNLAECIQLAMERQPRLAAQRASLAAAEDACRALENLRLAAVVDPEIPIRRRQAALGVTAAAA